MGIRLWESDGVGRGETKRKHTLAKNVTADNLWASASTRGRPR